MSRSFIPPEVKRQRTLIPEDTYIARLYQLVDIGTHAGKGPYALDKNGAQRLTRQLVLTWELPEALHVFKEGDPAKPFSTSQTYTFSLGKKSNLRADVESWRGKKLTDEEAAKFDIQLLLGKTCMLTIGHEESNGQTYANIVSIGSVPKSIVAPPPVNPQVSYHIDDGKGGNFSKLPEWLQKKISESEEFKNPSDQSEDQAAIDDAAADEEARYIQEQENQNR